MCWTQSQESLSEITLLLSPPFNLSSFHHLICWAPSEIERPIPFVPLPFKDDISIRATCLIQLLGETYRRNAELLNVSSRVAKGRDDLVIDLL